MRLRDIKQLASGHTTIVWQGWGILSDIFWSQANNPTTDFCHPGKRISQPLKKDDWVDSCHATEANSHFSCLGSHTSGLLLTSRDSFYYYFESLEIILFFYFNIYTKLFFNNLPCHVPLLPWSGSPDCLHMVLEELSAFHLSNLL